MKFCSECNPLSSCDKQDYLMYIFSLFTLLKHVQNALNKLVQWSNTTEFKFSPTKTECMLFSNHKLEEEVNLKINRLPLEQVNSVSYLGVKLDCHLRWDQLKNIKSKVIGLLKVMCQYQNNTQKLCNA